MAMKRRRLIDANVARLAPAVCEYTVWDTRHAGLGVRVRPSGHRSFVYRRKGECGARRITLGPAALTGVEEARRRASPSRPEHGPTGRKAARCRPSANSPQVRGGRASTAANRLREKPSSGSSTRAFSRPSDRCGWTGSPVLTSPAGSTTTAERHRAGPTQPCACSVEASTTRSSATISGRTRRVASSGTPAGSSPVVRGSPPSSPFAGRLRRRAAVMRVASGHHPPSLVDRLPEERGRTLRWKDVDGDTLNLADAKTGPRRVFLNAPAHAILERQPRSGCAYVFPSPSNPGRPFSRNLPFWRSVRKEAGVEDVRLHDLRHTFASHAVLQGIPLPVVSRMLGHKRPSMTLR